MEQLDEDTLYFLLKSGLQDRIQFSTVLYCTVLYFTVLYCTVLYCTAAGSGEEEAAPPSPLYCTVLYCAVLQQGGRGEEEAAPPGSSYFVRGLNEASAASLLNCVQCSEQ